MIDPLELIAPESRPLTPQPTDAIAKLRKLPGVRYLVWDIYGTLLISASGSTERKTSRERLLRSLLKSDDLPPFSLEVHLENLIAQEHARSRKNGISFPEIEIREIWQRFFESLSLAPPPDLAEFALRYELLTNPIWPMPGALEAMSHPATRGVISNAQFYTPLLLKSFELPRPPRAIYSFEHRTAKPGSPLFHQFLKDGPAPEEILYIGNDRLKDIAPAHEVGMRTAIFAGDRHSFRPRPERKDLPEPDAVVTSLAQIPSLLDE